MRLTAVEELLLIVSFTDEVIIITEDLLLGTEAEETAERKTTSRIVMC